MNNPRSGTLTIRQGTTSPATRGGTGSSSRRATTGGQDAASAGTLVKDEATFLAHLPVIDAIIAQVCRRYRLNGSDAEDFASEVRLHFIERDYEPLRRFEGRSSFRTYLIVIIQRLCLDYRNRTWGRWRPSVEAKRSGKVAVLIERLVARDGRSFDEVVEILWSHHGIAMDARLEELYAKLAKRTPARQFVAEVEAADIPTDAPSPVINVLRREQEFVVKRMVAAVDRARQEFPPEDRLILKMFLDDAMPQVNIARALSLNAKRLYPRIERLRTEIRRQLEAQGFSGTDLDALFADGVMSDPDVHEFDDRAGGAGTSEPVERARTPWKKS